MYGGRSYDSRGQGRWIGRLVLAGIGFLLTAAIGVNMLLAGAGVIQDSSEPPGLRSVLLAFLWLAGAAACVALAVDAEHGLRGLPRGRIAREASAARHGVSAARQGMLARLPSRWRSAPGGRHGPVSTLVAGLVFAVIGIVVACCAVSAFSQASRSSYTQSSGIADNARVVNVSNNQDTNCGRHGGCTTTYTATVTATLSQPVAGQDATTIDIPDNVPYVTGQVIPVLVDPRDPGYAELPGLPYASEGTAILLTAGAIVVIALGAFAVVRAVRMSRRGVVRPRRQPGGISGI